MTEELRVLLPVGILPEGSEVTKRGGELKYHIYREIIFHNHLRSAGKEPIFAKPGTVFLIEVTDSGNQISIVPEELKVLWSTNLSMLERLYQQEFDKKISPEDEKET